MKLCQCQKDKAKTAIAIAQAAGTQDLYTILVGVLDSPCTCQEKKEMVGPYVVGQSFVVSPIDGQLKDETTLTDEEKETDMAKVNEFLLKVRKLNFTI